MWSARVGLRHRARARERESARGREKGAAGVLARGDLGTRGTDAPFAVVGLRLALLLALLRRRGFALLWHPSLSRGGIESAEDARSVEPRSRLG